MAAAGFIIWAVLCLCSGRSFTVEAFPFFPPPTNSTDSPTPGSHQMIRLVNGTDECSGRVEVYLNEQWGSVCDDGWGQNEAKVVCRMLGCGQVAVSLTHYGPSPNPIWLDEVNCRGDEISLADCDMAEPGAHDCDHSEDTGVMCHGYDWTATTTTTAATPSTYQMIRLVNGTDMCSGMVQVYHQGQWGSVCDDHWDMDDAQVVCREVGCGPALHAYGNAHYSMSSGPIWLDDVHCMGDEYSLSQCDLPVLGDHNCGNHEDAGVMCARPSDDGPVTTEAPSEAPVSGEPLPSQHANFMLGRSGEVRGEVDPVMLDLVVSDTASGFVKEEAFGYNKDTGVYTAPFSGEYCVTVTSQLCVGAHSAAWDVMVEGRVEGSCSLQAGVVGAPCYHSYWLEKGQRMCVRMNSGCVWGLTVSGTAMEIHYSDYWYYYWNYW